MGTLSWAIAWAASSMAMGLPIGPSFTYQGQLRQGGVPVTGTANLQFTLWDAASDGNQLGVISHADAVTIANGIFAADVNRAGEFGTNAFTGESRWLEVAVNGAVLAPRQPLPATPYAHYASNASFATSTRAISIDAQNRVGIGTAESGSFYLSPVDTGRVGIRLKPNPDLDYTGGEIDLERSANSLGVISGGSATLRGGAGFTGVVKGGNGGDIILRSGEGGPNIGSGSGGPGGAIRLEPGLGGVNSDGVSRASSGLVFVNGTLSLGASNPNPTIRLTLVPNQPTGTGILLRSETMSANQFVDLLFLDPDGSTGPMRLRFSDNGSPSLDSVGGPFRAVDFVKISSAQFKRDIEPVRAGVARRLRALRPVTYHWDEEHGGGADVGFIAEEVAKVVPEAVQWVDGRPAGLSYAVLTTMALKALAEQQEELDRLKRDGARAMERLSTVERVQAENAALRARLDRLEAVLAKTASP